MLGHATGLLVSTPSVEVVRLLPDERPESELDVELPLHSRFLPSSPHPPSPPSRISRRSWRSLVRRCTSAKRSSMCRVARVMDSIARAVASRLSERTSSARMRGQRESFCGEEGEADIAV